MKINRRNNWVLRNRHRLVCLWIIIFIIIIRSQKCINVQNWKLKEQWSKSCHFYYRFFQYSILFPSHWQKKKKLLDFSLNLRAKNVCIYDMILKRIRIVSSCKNHLELKTIYCMVVNSHIKQLDGNCNVYIYVPSRRFVWKHWPLPIKPQWNLDKI